MQTTSRALLRVVLSKLLRLYPLLSGCGTLANMRLLAWSAGDGLSIARLRDGSLLHVHLDDYVGRAAYLLGELDPKISAVCRAALRPGDTMLDVGANYGLVTMQAARLVGPTGFVHAFEPQPELAELIRQSAALNGFAHVTVHPVGLSDGNSDRTMCVPEKNRGMGTVSADLPGRRITVILKEASRYLSSTYCRRPRLMKIDVEGHEAAVLFGAARWIATTKPEIILFEHNDPRAPDVFDLLQSHGYMIFGIPRAMLRMRLVRLAPGEHGFGPFHDFVAVHQTSSWRM